MNSEDVLHLLPESDIYESGYLNSMLNNFSSSYKLFWFRGIFKEIMDGNTDLSYQTVVARMIAGAWYPVIFYKLSLGYNDQLASAINYIHERLKVSRESSEGQIVDFICTCDDEELQKKVYHFTNLVPFRLIRPFYQREIEYVKIHDKNFTDSKVNQMIQECNRDDEEKALYRILDGRIIVAERWYTYIRKNAAVIEGWLNYKLVEYIQKRNPNVPAIPFKLFPPTDKDRNLTEATKFWNAVHTRMLLYDLYNGKEFNDDNYKLYGQMSIDHFIPWSFVLHNEIWNLYPSFKNINSGKNDRLPDKRRYLNEFCEAQFKGFMIARKINSLKKAMEEYLTVSRDIFELEESDRSHDIFVKSMKQTIEPLYQIANNQGYGVWWLENSKQD